MSIRLTDLPQAVPVAAYDEMRRVIIKRFGAVKGVRAILEFGTISLPGLSDFDTFILVDEDVPIVLPHMREFTDEQRYIMGGRRQVLAKGLFPYLNYWDPWFVEVKTIFGDQNDYRFVKDEFASGGYRALSLQFLYQKVVYGSLPLLATILGDGQLPVRVFFGDCVQYRYFLREFKKLGINYGAEDPGAPIYRSLFDNWFDISTVERQERMDRATKLFPESIAWALRTLVSALKGLPERTTPDGISPRTAAQRSLLKRYPGSYIVDTGARVFVYQRDRTTVGIECQALNVPGLKHLTRTIFLLPLSLACFGSVHLNTSGLLSAQCRSCTFTDLKTIPVYEDPHLLFLSHLSNRNLAETESVKNGRYYEMLYGMSFGSSSTGVRKVAGTAWRAAAGTLLKNAHLPVIGAPGKFVFEAPLS
jgi:hypothetical protein